MAILNYNNIDLQQNELKNVVIHKSATTPVGIVEGQVYYNTTDHKLAIYNGTEEIQGFHKPLTIAAGSTDYLGINANQELSVKNLAIGSVTVNNTATSLADFITANYTAGTEFQAGDIIVLTGMTPKSSFIHNGGTAITVADFTQLFDDVTATEVRGYLSASEGLSYNSATGHITTLHDHATINVNVNDELYVVDGGITQAKLSNPLVAKIVNGYAATVGDGTATSFAVTHNLGTTDVRVECYLVSTGETVNASIVRTNTNTITVTTTPAVTANDLRVLVTKVITS